MTYPVDKEAAALVLKHAIGYLRTGWCQDQGHIQIDGVDHYCAVGAMSQAMTDLGVPHTFYGYIESILARYAKGPVFYYNDFPGRTVDEVVHIFEQAIDHLMETSL